MRKIILTFGAILGIALALKLLPGISIPVDDEWWFPVVMCGLIFSIIGEVINAWPDNIRQASFVGVLFQACLGIVQDTLIWLLISWVGLFHVDGIGTAVLGGVITRLVVLVLLVFAPAAGGQAEEAEEGSGSTA